MSFLPKDYNIPERGGGYMKFKQGQNRFRIMSEPILGYETWIDVDGGRKPLRKPMDDSWDPGEHDPSKIKHFWAMIVWNYEAKDGAGDVQILEITQKGIQKSIKAMSRDKDWGSPIGNKGYDIVVTREGEGLETEYQTNPKPHKELEDGMETFVEDMNINLKALFSGDDPFEKKDITLEDVTESQTP